MPPDSSSRDTNTCITHIHTQHNGCGGERKEEDQSLTSYGSSLSPGETVKHRVAANDDCRTLLISLSKLASRPCCKAELPHVRLAVTDQHLFSQSCESPTCCALVTPSKIKYTGQVRPVMNWSGATKVADGLRLLAEKLPSGGSPGEILFFSVTIEDIYEHSI